MCFGNWIFGLKITMVAVTKLTLLVLALRKIPIADHKKMKEYILHHMRPKDKHYDLQTCSLWCEKELWGGGGTKQ